MADDGIMVSFHIKLIHLTVIRVPVESLIRVGLLKNAVSGVFFVGKDATDGSGCPFAALLGRRTQFYEFGCYRIRTLAGERFRINGRVDAPLAVVRPSQKSGRAACPHPALCETNRSHLSIVYTDIYSWSYQRVAVINHIQKLYPVVAFLLASSVQPVE